MKFSSTKWWQLAIVGALIASPVYANDNNANNAAATASDTATTASGAAAGTATAPAVLRAPSATAATDAGAQVGTSEASAQESIIDRMSVKYTLEALGPTLGTLDGNDGPGANLTLNHYWSFGYKISDRVSATLTPYFTTPIRAANPDGDDNLVFGDMYLTVFHNRLYKNEKYGINVAGYIRGYFPTSKASNDPDLAGTAKEQQNGKARIRLLPSKKWLDGALTFTMDTSFYVPFRKAGLGADRASSQRDYYFYFFPNLSYQVNDAWATYIAYNAPLSHFKDTSRGGNGRFERFSNGNSVEVGFEWTGVKGLLVNPFVAINQGKNIADADLAIVAQYSIL